jgi:hypothetical protein
VEVDAFAQHPRVVGDEEGEEDHVQDSTPQLQTNQKENTSGDQKENTSKQACKLSVMS